MAGNNPFTKEEMQELKKLSDELEASLVRECFPDKIDWVYRDLPRMTRKVMADFVNLVGKENLHWLTFADYGDSARGQVIISPAGMRSVEQYNRENKNV